MGVINHNCIVATTCNDKYIEKFNQDFLPTIPEEFRTLFLVGEAVVNGDHTIVMLPDGSKEGWTLSNTGDEVREKFVLFLNSLSFPDGSNPFDFVEIGYGEYGQKILRGNNVNGHTDEEYAGL